MPSALLKQVEAAVRQYCEQIKNSPEARLQSRKAFYKKYGDASHDGKMGLGNSELAFMTWEARTVLQPKTGSMWWSAVNLHFIYLSELGAQAREAGVPTAELPVPAQLWVQFIDEPGSRSWYRAHNASIIDGYLRYPNLAGRETRPEQIFINMVLYRLLYAQALVEGVDSIFPKLGRILGNPRGDAVAFITHLDGYYPAHYPMNQHEIAMVLGKAHNLEELGVRILDDVLIEPELSTLYEQASAWNQQPALMHFIAGHRPAYPDGIPIPHERHGCFIGMLAAIYRWMLRGASHIIIKIRNKANKPS